MYFLAENKQSAYNTWNDHIKGFVCTSAFCLRPQLILVLQYIEYPA